MSDMYERLQAIIGNLPEHLSVLEEQIDLPTQVAYHKRSEELKEPDHELPLPDNYKQVLAEGSPDEQKDVLIAMGQQDQVSVYRDIQAFIQHPHNSDALKLWATLALQHCRMNLESSLLDEDLIFVSTGLGGDKNRLRFFVVFAHYEAEDFTPTQQKVLRNEVEYALKVHEGELESFFIGGDYARLSILLPMAVDVYDFVSSVQVNCNELGEFIHEDVLVTNIRKLSDDEIRSFLDGTPIEKILGQYDEDYAFIHDENSHLLDSFDQDTLFDEDPDDDE